MKGLPCLLLLIIFSLCHTESKAQTPEVLGGNILNGALTGTMLGAAAMGLQNTDDFSAVRIGVGAGVLGGAAVAVYDLTTLPLGEQLYISGVFNDGMNSSVIILLDTFYGAASGAVIGVAGMLVADRPIVKGLQYGSGIGAWAGFGFGLADAFILSQRNRDRTMAEFLQRESLITMNSDHYRVGFIQPSAYFIPEISGTELTSTLEPVLGVVSFKMSL